MKNNFDLILKNGNVTLKSDSPSPGKWQLVKEDIGVISGKIAAIGQLSSHNSTQVLDCTGLTILPGFIDSQVHFREPGLEHKEDFNTGSRGAIKGGITAVFDMPNTKPAITNLKTWQQKIDCANNNFWCDYAFYMGASLHNIEDLSQLETLAGCCGTKIFMGSSTGDLLVDQLEGLKKILLKLKRNVAVHSEDESLLLSRSNLRQKGLPQTHSLWRNEEVALTSTQNLLKLAREASKKVHVLHVSTESEIELLAKNRDIATVEVTPQHLTLSEPEAYEALGTFAQMNPPIRTKRHQEALWKALNSGAVDVLGSDHAPHTREEKEKEYPLSPSGMPGVQTLLPIMLDHVHHQRLSLFRLVELMAETPASIFQLKNKGSICLGRDADFTIVDLKKKWKIENSWLESKCGWSPFEDKAITGYPTATIIRGHIVMNEAQILETPIGQLLDFDQL